MRQLRNTRQRQLVLDAVMARCDHPSADEIYLDVRKADDKISRATVYRNLNLLAETGEILHVKVPNADRYDARTQLHYHMLCTKCGSICDAPIAYHTGLDQEAAATGYTVLRHRNFFEGICPDCQTKD